MTANNSEKSASRPAPQGAPKATERYVDASVDAQRQYSEGLFQRARERIEAVAKKQTELGARTTLLEEGLQRLRQPPTVYPPGSAAMGTAVEQKPKALPAASWSQVRVVRSDGSVVAISRESESGRIKLSVD